MNIAIITGASSGMGKEFVRQLDQNANLDELWLIARSEEKLSGISFPTRAKKRLFPLDLTDETAYDYLKNLLNYEKPRIKILVNSAGFGVSGTVDTLSERCQAEMIQLNCIALTRMTRICIPYMQKGSRILQIASASAFMPQPAFAVYAATKAYVLSFSRALNVELKKRHIYVTSVCPGPVDTPFFETSYENGKPTGIKKFFVSKPDKVVAKAIKDCVVKKELSIYGIPMKLLHLASKLPIQGAILKFWKV